MVVRIQIRCRNELGVLSSTDAGAGGEHAAAVIDQHQYEIGG